MLRLPADKLDVGAGITNLGMDSLMVLELQLAVSRRLGVELATMDLLKGPSLQMLAESIAARFQPDPSTRAGGLRGPPTYRLPNNHGVVYISQQALAQSRATNVPLTF